MIIDNFKDLKQALERNARRDELRAADATQPQPQQQQFWCHICGYKRTCPACQAAP